MTDRQLKSVARQFRKGILHNRASAMFCYMVCAPLAGMLESVYGLKCELEEGDFGDCNHVWIKLADGRILDPTADQFNSTNHADAPLPEVYLGKPTAIHAWNPDRL